jgi:DNA repair protein RadA/Sms
MAKARTVFVCQNCGVSSPKWIGKCPSCNEWNTYVEEVVSVPASKSRGSNRLSSSPQLITEIESTEEKRIDLHNQEMNRILGGGLVPGSLVLIGGEPGIGKSTLALQLALHIGNLKTLYVSGEESSQQVKLRANRLGIKNQNCYFLSETQLENIIQHVENLSPDLLVIDSIQTLYSERIESSPGSVSQVRDCTTQLLQFAKERALPVLLIGHINKEGNLAGPKVLEHIVDVVLQFEGDHNYIYRILRSTKNRYGSTSELGIFEMQNKGLREVPNPSDLLISHYEEELSGMAISATIDGIRPFLIETQALVSSAVYGTPQRSSTGFDYRRLNMLLAVLEKKAGFRLAARDVFLNIAGGIRVNDPAIDLAVISAILSSNEDLPIPKGYCFSGEIGLSGEIRPVNRIEQRIREAEKLGFKKIFISKYNRKGIDPSKFKLDIIAVGKVDLFLKELFG